MRHRRKHLDSTGVSSSTWISNEVSITNVSNLTQLENQTIDGVEYLVYSFKTAKLMTMSIRTSIEVNKMLITSSYGGTMTFGNDFTYDGSAYSFSSGETVAVCRDDATSFDSAIITDNAQLSSTVTLYIPAAAIRYIRLEITVSESLEYSDTIITGTYKAYYTYNTSRDVYTEEGLIIESFPATGDGSAEVTEIFTFTKYGLEATAEVVRGKRSATIIATYNVATDRKVTLFSETYFNSSCIVSMEIDGVKVEIENSKSLSAGTHVVIYKLNESRLNLWCMFNGASSLINVDISGLSGYSILSADNMFRGCSNLTSIEFGVKLNTSKVTTFESLFEGCTSLSEVNVSAIDTSSCESFSFMFSKCENLTTINGASNWDTSKVTDTTYMFSRCYKLENLDFLEYFNMSKVTTVYQMFYDCKKITNLDCMKKWDISSMINMRGMLSGCASLTSFSIYSDIPSSTKCDSMLDVGTSGTFYHKGQSNYDKIVAVLPSTWKAVQVS